MRYDFCEKFDCPYCKRDYVNPEILYCSKAGCGADDNQDHVPEECPYEGEIEELWLQSSSGRQ